MFARAPSNSCKTRIASGRSALTSSRVSYGVVPANRTRCPGVSGLFVIGWKEKFSKIWASLLVVLRDTLVVYYHEAIASFKPISLCNRVGDAVVSKARYGVQERDFYATVERVEPVSYFFEGEDGSTTTMCMHIKQPPQTYVFKPTSCSHSIGVALSIAQAEAHVDELEMALCDLVLALLEGNANSQTCEMVLKRLRKIFETYFLKVMVDQKF